MAALAMVALALAGLVWLTSDRAATELEPATGPPPALDEPGEPPTQLTELWRAESPATPAPVAANGTVATGSGGTVTGRAADTGEQRWRYTRDAELCALAGQWSAVTAVYENSPARGAGSRGDPSPHDPSPPEGSRGDGAAPESSPPEGSRGCGEATQLDADTGERTAQRTGYPGPGAELTGDGTHLVATGAELLTAWSAELVRTTEFGSVPTPLHPGTQPRPGCRYSSVAVAAGHIGITERCADEQRLTVITTTHEDDDGELQSDQPNEVFSEPLDADSARVVALSAAEPGRLAAADGQELLVYDPSGRLQAAHELDLPVTAQGRGEVVPATARTETGVYWYTGSGTLALDDDDLAPRWSLPETLGPGVGYAGILLVPVEDGLAVVDEATGEVQRTLDVDRGGYDGPVRLARTGPIVLEQRGEEVIALG